MKMKSFREQKIALVLAGGAWLLTVCVGLWLVWGYQSTPGRRGIAPAAWPAASRIQREAGLPTLLMVVHPHCPCSRASIGELALLMARCRRRVNAKVLFVKPATFADGWEQTDLWESAKIIPGVTMFSDDAGREAARFGSRTSGHTLLYDAEGRLIFSGGITAGRAHSGDNAGRDALTALITGGDAARNETDVFGCPIFDEASDAGANGESKDSCHADISN